MTKIDRNLKIIGKRASRADIELLIGRMALAGEIPFIYKAYDKDPSQVWYRSPRLGKVIIWDFNAPETFQSLRDFKMWTELIKAEIEAFEHAI